MKTWYKAVCDACGEAIDMFVSNPSCSASLLGDHDAEIQAWLEKHWSCELRLIWRDDHLDKLWEDGFVRQGHNPRAYVRLDEPTKREVLSSIAGAVTTKKKSDEQTIDTDKWPKIGRVYTQYDSRRLPNKDYQDLDVSFGVLAVDASKGELRCLLIGNGRLNKHFCTDKNNEFVWQYDKSSSAYEELFFTHNGGEDKDVVTMFYDSKRETISVETEF